MAYMRFLLHQVHATASSVSRAPMAGARSIKTGGTNGRLPGLARMDRVESALRQKSAKSRRDAVNAALASVQMPECIRRDSRGKVDPDDVRCHLEQVRRAVEAYEAGN